MTPVLVLELVLKLKAYYRRQNIKCQYQNKFPLHIASIYTHKGS